MIEYINDIAGVRIICNYKDDIYKIRDIIRKQDKIRIVKEKDYIKFSIKKSKLPNAVYDIVIDPGHGGNDTGASGKLNGTTYYESELTLEISLLLKKRLEDLGLKVKLTRDSDIFMDPYGDEGRAVIVNDYSPKYSLSIHLNSAEGTMSYGGVEVYTPNDIDYGFATTIAHSLSDIVGYSKKPNLCLYRRKKW